jgi:hypothetical protein
LSIGKSMNWKLNGGFSSDRHRIRAETYSSW